MSHRNSIPRKPVPHVTDAWGNPVELSPPSATARLLPEADKRGQIVQDDPSDSLAPVLSRLDLGESRDQQNVAEGRSNAPQQTSPLGPRIARRSLDKPLPKTPRDSHQPDYEPQPESFDPAANESPTEVFYGKSKSDLERELGVTGVVDLHNSEDTTVHTRIAPAVTHETIRQDIHEILHEEIHREIHSHDVYHRILPIKHVEILPARHYIEDANGIRREVSADQVPGRSPKFTHTLLTECFKETLPESRQNDGPRQFSARKFPGSEGDYREYKKPDGSLRTERWWVHPPTLATGAEMARQTEPFHFHDESTTN